MTQQSEKVRDGRICGLCKHHVAHPWRGADEKICSILLKECAQITVTLDSHECRFPGFEKKTN